MKNIINEVTGQAPERLPGFHVLLPACLAKTPCNKGSAVQAVLLLTFWLVGHAKFFLKIGTITAVHPMFLAITKSIF
jgi:hypothetical protein